MKKSAIMIFCLMVFGTATLFAQHRGDLFSFQGLDETVDGGAQSMAMGGAWTAMSGRIDNLFHNSAGLALIKKWTVSVSGNYYKKDWWENQAYRPDRYFVTLPFYLEGMYVPDPKNNGVLDRDLALDSSYVVHPPKDSGKRVDSREAADWTRQKSAPVFNNIALAVPLHLLGRDLVLAASYQQKLNFLDFDRDDTYLVPMLGTSLYQGFVARMNGTDTLNLKWFQYQRERTGSLHSVHGALAVKVTKQLSLGLALDYTFGTSTDKLQLIKKGYFGLIDENKFFFTFDTLNHLENGDSDFKTLNSAIGLQYRFEHVTIGFNVNLPRTITRNWHYTVSEQTANSVSNKKTSGQDRLEIPASYRFGLVFKPIKAFTFSLAYGFAPYSQSKVTLGQADSTFQKWPDQHALMGGVRYQATDFLTLMAGYRWKTALFVPDGVGFRDRGPDQTSISFGGQISFGSLGSVILAFETKSMSYHDTYFSNTNYATEKMQNFIIQYVYQF